MLAKKLNNLRVCEQHMEFLKLSSNFEALCAPKSPYWFHDLLCGYIVSSPGQHKHELNTDSKLNSTHAILHLIKVFPCLSKKKKSTCTLNYPYLCNLLKNIKIVVLPISNVIQSEIHMTIWLNGCTLAWIPWNVLIENATHWIFDLFEFWLLPELPRTINPFRRRQRTSYFM